MNILYFVVSFYSWCLDYFPYSAVLLFTEVSWLFSPSPSPQSSHAGSVLCLTSPFLRLHQQTCQSLCLWKCVSLFISPSGFSQRKDAHSPCIPSCLGSSENEGQRANCQRERDRQRWVNNLAHHSGFCCSSKHEQNTVLWFPPSGCPARQKTNMAALGWVEGKDSLKGVYL